MGTFNRLLDATYEPPHRWELNTALSFDCDAITENDIALLKAIGVRINTKGKITVAKGFETDMASVPRILWNVISPFDTARAAVIHDYLYAKCREFWALNPEMTTEVQKCRQIADDVFRDAMESLDPRPSGWKIWACYRAVRLFGTGAIKS